MTSYALRTTIRQARRQKGTTLINLIGLATGIATSLIILLYCQQELSYDSYPDHPERVVRVARDWKGSDGSISIGFSSLAPRYTDYLRDLPGVEAAARMFKVGSALVEIDGRHYREEQFYLVDRDLFDVFTIPILRGDREHLFAGTNECALSRSAAAKFFGNADPIGKTLTLDDEYSVTVSAVFEDVPRRSHVHFDVLMPLQFFRTLSPDYYHDMFDTDKFSDNITFTYLRLQPGVTLEEMDARIKQMLDRVIGGWENKSGEWIPASSRIILKLQPIRSIHLESNQMNEIEERGNLRLIQLFIGIGVLIILIATINFVNLSTARATTRAREVGLRKVVGAQNRSLVLQFFTESTITVSAAFILAWVILLIVHPWLDKLFGQPVELSLFGTASLLPVSIGVLLFTALASGFYPALVLSAFQPAAVLRGGSSKGGGSRLRQMLVVLQFAISASLVIGILTVGSQVRFLVKQDLGFDKENLIVINADKVIWQRWNGLRERLLKIPGVVSTAVSKRVPSGVLGDAPGFTTEVKRNVVNGTIRLPHVRVGPDFITTYGLEVVAGRVFDRTSSTDSSEAYMLNETAVKQLGWSSPEEAIGAPFQANGYNPGRVIGVVRDFHYETLRKDISPMVLYVSRREWNTVTVRLAAGDPRPTIQQIETLWKEYRPFEMSWEFLEDRLNALYANETRMLRLLGVFSTLAVVIAGMGLFGLASFAAERRTHEIAIRKTFGAATRDIVMMLSSDFIRLVLIGCVIGLPPTAYLLSRWLDGFAYRVPLQPWHFFAAVFAAMLIAIVAVSSRALHAASVNPADSLRME
ncbi:MAG: ABC transporter permease [bacterium]